MSKSAEKNTLSNFDKIYITALFTLMAAGVGGIGGMVLVARAQGAAEIAAAPAREKEQEGDAIAALKGNSLTDIHLGEHVHYITSRSSVHSMYSYEDNEGINFTAKNLIGETVNGAVTFKSPDPNHKGATVRFRQ